MLKQLWKRFSALFIAAIVLFVLSIFIFIQILIYYSQDIPDYKQLEEYSPASITRIYTSSGDIISELADERRIYIEYDEIPQLVINAFLAAEDKNFFEHSGIDIFSIMRATFQNVLNIGKNKNLVGGSTITQQVIKNFLLTNERSLSRKIKEAILAYRVTNAYSKEKILELYLNELFLGDHSYGILVAADNYFDKDLDELNIQEAAMLAALPKSPTYINPRKHYDRAIERRDWVIERMENENMISKEEEKQALDSKIELALKKRSFTSKYPYYAEEVRKQLIDMYGRDAVYTMGFTVISNLNTKFQDVMLEKYRSYLEKKDNAKGYRGPLGNIDIKAEGWHDQFINYSSKHVPYNSEIAIVLEVNNNDFKISYQDGSKQETLTKDAIKWTRKSLKSIFKKGDIITVGIRGDKKVITQFPKVSGAMLSMEPYSGKILAFAGGYSYNASVFNRAFQAKRQPGSTFKTFVYLTALENGYSPNTIILDEPISLSQGPGMPLWTPKNYSGDYLGPITLRKALEKSRNLATVRLLKSVGIDKVIATSERLNIYDNPPRNFAICLGAHESTLVDMVNGFNTFASDGRLTEPNIIAAVYNNKGELIYSGTKSECNTCDSELIEFLSYETPHISYNVKRAVDKESNYQILSMLEGAIERGTGRRARSIGKTLAGKTGTTNDSKDTWFIGFSPEITTGLYIGYDIPKSLGAKAAGSNYALPLFIEYTSEILKDVTDKQFTTPDSLEIVNLDYNNGMPSYHYDSYRYDEYGDQYNYDSYGNYGGGHSSYGGQSGQVIQEYFKSDNNSNQRIIRGEEWENQTDDSVYYNYGNQTDHYDDYPHHTNDDYGDYNSYRKIGPAGGFGEIY